MGKQMKSVLISIQPKWCRLIALGKKTVEVRKKRPKIQTPFKCYVYCTNSELLTKSHSNGSVYFASKKKYKKALERNGNVTLSGKVIGEFVCDFIDNINLRDARLSLYSIESCVDIVDLFNYADGKSLYFYHISDLVIYDEPMSLPDFKKPCPVNDCFLCDYAIWNDPPWTQERRPVGCGASVQRPPQSWCYVEEL